MNSFWKGVSLTLILLVGFFSLYNLYMGNYRTQNNISAYDEEEYQRQVEIYDQQAKKATEQQLETERQLKETAELQKIAIDQAKRMDELLDRYEEHADRYDAILEKWEEQAGIKNQ